MCSGHGVRPPVIRGKPNTQAFYKSRKGRNRLMHALNGNTTVAVTDGTSRKKLRLD